MLALLGLVLFLFLGCGGPSPRGEIRLLVFSKTMGYRHQSIAAGQQALFEMAQEHGFQVDTTEDASLFTEENLARYSAIVFLNTTGDVLDPQQQVAFERYIQAGGGYVGIHAATDTEYDWRWYGRLAGAYFASHPNNPNVRDGRMEIVDHQHASTAFFGEEKVWHRTDEFYNFRELYTDEKDGIKPLVMIDETSYEGGTNGDFHPMSWYHEFDGGRAWYTNFGHTDETYSEPKFRQHLWGGIQYAVGPNLKPDFSKAYSLMPPDPDRFLVTTLAENLVEPMELEVMRDGRVLFTERGGKLRMYDPNTGNIQLVGQLDVYNGQEDGLVGLALDPKFEENQWLYLYYAPTGDVPKFNLSRFTMRDDTLHMPSERILLEVGTQREQCCHTGGSIEFDDQGLLYLSTGDDTNPFETRYAPINEGEGRSHWDAQKSSANPNDLRGKILRIKPTEYGTYEIPDGNLFPKDGSQGRPEVYVMGCRNPYRISVDSETGYVYWGDVGPDGQVDSTLGPRGYDEINQARQPGFFGWPYFIANNRPYRDHDFQNQTLGDWFDPIHPVNYSPNNTGIKNLPPAQPAFIFYPYAASPEFPILGKGGRNAMAGPVYHYEQFEGTPSQFPKYFDDKLFVYDFMRD
ncbi:MAG: ThuA domain-containing protein, partial [Bacteroidetes bacterium]